MNFSREELAKIAGISHSMLSKIERDETNPTILLASKLARSLKTTVSALLGERTDETQHVGDVYTYIELLKSTDEHLEKIITDRIALEPDFKATIHHTYILDKDCRYLFASFLGAKTIGMTPSEMVGKHWRELMMPADMEEVERNVRGLFLTGRTIATEAIFNGPLGHDYYDYRLKPLSNNAGSIEAVIATVRNITLKKLAELEMRKKVHNLRYLVNVCPLGIITIDNNEIITTLNKAAQVLLSPHSLENWMGKDIKSLIAFAGLNYKQTPIIKAIAGEEVTLEHIEAWEGNWRVSASPLKGVEDTIEGAIVFIHSIPISDYLNKGELTLIFESVNSHCTLKSSFLPCASNFGKDDF